MPLLDVNGRTDTKQMTDSTQMCGNMYYRNLEKCPSCDANLYLRFCSGVWFRVCMRCDFMAQVAESEAVKLTGRF